MSLRQVQRRSHRLLQGDNKLLQVLRSELAHELSVPTDPAPLHSSQNGSLVGGFKPEWDDPRTRDVFLIKRHGSEEEVAVSAILGPLVFEGENVLPRRAKMKVSLKKFGFDPVLSFACSVFSVGEGGQGAKFRTDFRINKAWYHPSLDCLGANKYMGPRFSSLDPQLRKAWKEYLIARGIDVELTDFVLNSLYTKDNTQYVSWLQRLVGFITKDK